MVLGGIYVTKSTPTVSAFGERVYQIFLKIVKDTQYNLVTIEKKSPPVVGKPSIGGAEKTITLEEARELAGYSLVMPSYLPPGTKLVKITGLEMGSTGVVYLTYDYQGKEILFTQRMEIGENSDSYKGVIPMGYKIRQHKN